MSHYFESDAMCVSLRFLVVVLTLGKLGLQMTGVGAESLLRAQNERERQKFIVNKTDFFTSFFLKKSKRRMLKIIVCIMCNKIDYTKPHYMVE